MIVNLVLFGNAASLVSLQGGELRHKDFDDPYDAVIYAVQNNTNRVGMLAEGTTPVPQHISLVNFDWERRQEIYVIAKRCGGFVKVHHPEKATDFLKDLYNATMEELGED